MSNKRSLQLLSFSGLSEADCTAVYQLLASEGVFVMDVHQGTVYSQRSFSVLADVPEAKRDRLSKALDKFKQSDKNGAFNITVAAVSDEQYESWLSQRGKPHYIMTILTKELPTTAFAAIESVISKHDMSIDSMQRLSGYTMLHRGAEAERDIFCLELTMRGYCSDEQLLRTELLETGQSLGINLGLQRDDIFRRHRRLLVMDMDSTLIKVEVIDELARIQGPDTAAKVAELTKQAMAGGLNYEQSLRKRVALLAGIKVEQMERLAEELPLSDGVDTLFAQLDKLGYHTAIITGGFDFFATRLQERLNIDAVHANSLEVVAGELTGKVVGPIIDGDGKAECLRSLVDELGIEMEQSIAVGDGANDIPMISAAGMGIAYHSRPMLLHKASHSVVRVGLDGILYLIGLRAVQDWSYETSKRG